MTFKLPYPPSAQAGKHELADFAELLCWLNGKVSARQIVAYLGQIGENDFQDGCNDEEDEKTDYLVEVMIEIEERASACRSGYPFSLEMEGTVLENKTEEGDAVQSLVYQYLLLSTRLNMKSNRTHADIDGTALLETLSAHVLKNYLGASNAQSLVFGTATPGSFEDKVNGLCNSLREGSGFVNRDSAPVVANDDKLDAVAWVPFADKMPGQLIVFGQCKTGTSWQNTIGQLRPDVFIDKWMKQPILVTPLRVFCVSEAADRTRWNGVVREAGILFDRCRLVEFCGGLPEVLVAQIQEWTIAAKATVEL